MNITKADFTKDNLKKNYTTFDGKLSQPEFLKLLVILLIAGFVAGFILGLLATVLAAIHLTFVVFILYLIIIIPMCIAQFSIVIRRWHDLGQTGWLSLLLFIPLVGILTLVYLAIAKTPGDVSPAA